MHKIRYEGRSHETWGELPDVGSRAPDVSLVNTRLQDVSLASWHGLRKVIFSFPSIDLSACAAAVATFDRISRDYDDVAALMVSCDLPFAFRRYLEQKSRHCALGHPARGIRRELWRAGRRGTAEGHVCQRRRRTGREQHGRAPGTD
jgi:hypothetical protein